MSTSLRIDSSTSAGISAAHYGTTDTVNNKDKCPNIRGPSARITMTMNTCSDNKHMPVSSHDTSNSSQNCIEDATTCRTPIRKSLEGINKPKWRSRENVCNGTQNNSQCLHISSLSSTSSSSSNFNEGNMSKDIKAEQSCSLALSSPSSTVSRAESSTTHLSTTHNAKLSSSPFMSRTKSSIARLSTNNKAKSSSQSPTMSRTETSIARINTNNNAKLSSLSPFVRKPESSTYLSPNHNAARERSRVKTLRAAFLELQRRLPAVPEDTKLSKLDVLVLATTYIAHLTSTLATHSVNAASNTNSRNILIHHQNQSKTTAPPTAIHHAVQWRTPTSNTNDGATDGGYHCKLQAKDTADDKTNIRHKHVQTSGGEGSRTKSYNTASGGSLSRGYLRPVKKWPMRSRLYTGIMASTNAGRKY